MKQKMSRREDYLKMIHTLSQNGQVRGYELADKLGITRPSVCIYLKRLVKNGDIIMDSHHCVHLTSQGLAIAESILDRHSMLSDLLEDLGVPKTIALTDACAMEHSISPETYEALKQLLEDRRTDTP